MNSYSIHLNSQRYCYSRSWLKIFHMLREGLATKQDLFLWKARFILIWHCKRQRKIRCLERDLNSHLRVSRLWSLLGLQSWTKRLEKKYKIWKKSIFQIYFCFFLPSPHPNNQCWIVWMRNHSTLIWGVGGYFKLLWHFCVWILTVS